MKEVQRLIRKVQERGLSYWFTHPQSLTNYARRNISKLFDRLPIRDEVLYIVEMPLSLNSISFNGPGMKIPTIRIDSVPPLLDFVRLRESEDPIWKGTFLIELKERFSRRDLCFAALDDNKIVSVQFLTFGQHYCREIDYLLTFPKDVCASIDSYTLSHFRGRGFHEATHYAILSYLAQTKYKSVYGWIFPWNKLAFRVHNSLGFKKIILEITMKQCLGLRCHIVRQMNITIDEFLRDKQGER